MSIRKKITQEEYQRIEHLAECALSAKNKAEANEYIQRLDYLCSGLVGAASIILSDLKGSLSNAAGRVPDKETRSYFVRMDLSELADHVERDELHA